MGVDREVDDSDLGEVEKCAWMLGDRGLGGGKEQLEGEGHGEAKCLNDGCK
jgi:hypothetical protein